MDVNCYRLAYNVFHCNWIKFGIPEKEIPLPETDEVDSLDSIIPGFSKVVLLFQIASRKDLKTFFDENRQVHNLDDFYTCFQTIMKQVIPEGSKVVDLAEDIMKQVVPKLEMVIDSPKDTKNESISEETQEEFLSEDVMEEVLSEDIMKEEDLSEDIMKEEDLPEDVQKQDQAKDVQKQDQAKDVQKQDQAKDVQKQDQAKDVQMEDQAKDVQMEDQAKDVQMEGGLPDNIILPADVPWLIAYSLAICIELILCNYDNNKNYMKLLPKIWEKYFNENLKRLCDEARCSENELKDLSCAMPYPDELLDAFVAANKSEYENIEDKFIDYNKRNCKESPKLPKYEKKFRNLPKILTFPKMKAKFIALKKICKCVKKKGSKEDEMPLLGDSSPDTSDSSQASPPDLLLTTL